jgi:hypothetical protein
MPWTVERVRAVVAGHPDEHRAAPVVGAGCGLRQGDVFGLAVDAVDFLRRTLHVRQQVRLVGGQLVFSPPKGGREREVPLPDWVNVALAEHLRVHPATEVTLPWRDPAGAAHTAALMFTNRDDRALTRAYYQTTPGRPRSPPRRSNATAPTASTRSATTTPACSNGACRFAPWPSTWATTTPVSPCGPTHT